MVASKTTRLTWSGSSHIGACPQRCSQTRRAPGTARTDLVLSLAEDPATGGFLGSWELSTDLFDPVTIQRLGRSFAVLLSGAAADPDAPVASLPLMPDEERQQVLVEWNQTATAWPRHASLGDLFTEQAAKAAGAVAVVWNEGAMTWAELEQRWEVALQTL